MCANLFSRLFRFYDTYLKWHWGNFVLSAGITVDKYGVIFFVDGTMIRRIDQNGIISTLLGFNDLTSARPLSCDAVMDISQVWPFFFFFFFISVAQENMLYLQLENLFYAQTQQVHPHHYSNSQLHPTLPPTDSIGGTGASLHRWEITQALSETLRKEKTSIKNSSLAHSSILQTLAQPSLGTRVSLWKADYSNVIISHNKNVHLCITSFYEGGKLSSDEVIVAIFLCISDL